MDTLLVMVLSLLGYIVMYRLYGQFIGKIIFQINAKNRAPSEALEDGIDYVPTRKEIVFGHHFTSIAGTGPIVGPAIAIIWGWVPALIWVFAGSIFMGAVHDFGSLVISMRNKGRSISEFTSQYISPRTRFYFFVIIFLELWLVIAIFGMVIALIFAQYPSSVFPVWMQLLIAIGLGMVIRRKGSRFLLASLVAVVLMYITVVAGNYLPFEMPNFSWMPATGSWTIILLIYAYVASILPVTTLLQPRDFINAFQLLIAMGLMVLGVLFSAFFTDIELVAPAVQLHPAEAPPLWPFLFITIACGAISGFHSLVASGTSAKQVKNEKDALFVGYGAMVTEGMLATLVIIAVAAGIGLGYQHESGMLLGGQAWSAHYASWTAAKGLTSKIDAFVTGAANMIETLRVPHIWAVTIMGVFVASFAGTTMDSATRIQRYVLTELFDFLKLKRLRNIYLSTGVAIATAAFLAFASGADGTGALSLWPIFGAVNQTLAALALIVLTLYLKTKGGLKWLIGGLPALFMVGMTLWASVLNQFEFWQQNNWLLVAVNAIIILLVVLIVIEGLKKFIQLSKPISTPNQ